MLPFQNITVRSADDLSADLSACRSFRHLRGKKKLAAIAEAFKPKIAEYYSPLHQKMGYACEDCGRPRSDVSGPDGKCQACYRNKSVKDSVFASDAFEIIVRTYGYSCDTCNEVTEVPEDRALAAATRILENLDGAVRPILCKRCSRDFTAFCTREYERDARAYRTPGHDKLVLAYVAHAVAREGKRIWLSQYNGSAQ